MFDDSCKFLLNGVDSVMNGHLGNDNTSNCINVGLKICMAISGPMIMNFGILYINKCTPEDIPKSRGSTQKNVFF